MSDIIEVALAKSPRLRVAERMADEAARGVDVAKGRLFPRVDAFADYQYSGFDRRNDTRLFADVGRMPRLGPGTKRDDNRQFDENLFTGGLRLSFPIYVGGRLVADLEANKLTSLLAQDRIIQTRDELIFNLSSTYFNILRLQENTKATEASVKALEEARRVIEQLVEVGKAPKVDLFKVNTRLAAVRQELIRVKNELELTHALLNTLMGIDVTQRVKVRGPLEYTPEVFELKRSIDEALGRRPELQIRRKEIGIQEQRVRIAKGERLPSVDLRVQYIGGGGFQQVFPIQDDFTAGVNISVPIFTGGVISSRIAQELEKLARVEAEFERAKLDVILEVESSYLNIIEAGERIKTAQVALEEAREALRIEQLKTEVGKGIVEDLLDAQAAELQAETNYLRALADHNTAVVGLRKAIGAIR